MTPLAWLGILAILLVIEAITVGLTTVWFAGGALVACITSWLGGGIVVCREPSGKKSRSDTAGQQPGPDRAGEDQ